MEKHYRIVAILLVVILISGCSEIQFRSFEQKNSGIQEEIIPIIKASGERVRLLNHRNATNPTYDELISFLREDSTDKQFYDDYTFVCSDFAEMLHNNAEANGIRAGFVAIDIVEREPHAINVFNTVDRGLVFVDCTGNDPTKKVYQFVDGNLVEMYPENNDKIAYVKEGKEYGLIYIDKAESPEYSFYEEYKLKREKLENDLARYNKEVEKYNREVEEFIRKVEAYKKELDGRTVIHDREEYERLTETYAELNSIEEQLNAKKQELDLKLEALKIQEESLGKYLWDSLGVVSEIEIYW
jgi:hypothetical protein